VKKLFALFAIVVSSLALAHSELVKSTPAKGATVKVAPANVTLTFDEAVEMAFSSFKVYAYTGEITNGKLRAFARQKIALKNDVTARADAGVTSSGTTKTVTLKLKPNLKTGAYVVMWKALGVDGHSVEDQFYFRVKP
jgi:copper resistance protein C